MQNNICSHISDLYSFEDKTIKFSLGVVVTPLGLSEELVDNFSSLSITLMVFCLLLLNIKIFSFISSVRSFSNVYYYHSMFHIFICYFSSNVPQQQEANTTDTSFDHLYLKMHLQYCHWCNLNRLKCHIKQIIMSVLSFNLPVKATVNTISR